MGGAVGPKLALGSAGFPEHPSVRLARLFEREARPGDALIALDVTGTLASYAVARSGRDLPIEPFPAATLHYLGESALNQVVAATDSSLRQEAVAVAGKVRGRRVWILGTDIYQDDTGKGYPRLRQLLMNALHHHSLGREHHVKAADGLDLVLLEPR